MFYPTEQKIPRMFAACFETVDGTGKLRLRRFSMAIASFEIETYDVRLARQLDTHVEGNLVRYHSLISCRGSGYTLAIYFLTNTSYIPNNAFDAAMKRGTMYLPFEQYKVYIDLLRNERPIYCFLNSSYPLQNGIYTGTEPVGESE